VFAQLRTRIFLAMSLLVILCVGSIAVVTLVQGNRIALNQINASLISSRVSQKETASARFQSLLLINQLISSDPYFSSYIGHTSGNDLGFGEEIETDTESIVDLLSERNETLRFEYGVGFDFAIVLDTEGEQLATTDDTILSDIDDPVLKPMLEDLETVTGYWNRKNHVYQIAAVPLASDDELVGFLILGLEAAQKFVEEVKGTGTTEFTIFGPSENDFNPLFGSIPEDDMQALSNYLAKNLSENNLSEKGNFEITLSDESWVVVYGRLSGESDVGTSVSLVSLDVSLEDFRQLRNLMLLVAFVAVLMSVVFAYFVSRRTTKPLVDLANAAESAARGDYRAKFDVTEDQDELSVLTRSFDSLLSDLREKRDMEGFVTSLSRLQPDSEEESTILAARTNDVKTSEKAATLIAFEMRELMDSKLRPEDLVLATEAANKNLELVIRRNGGVRVNSNAYRTFAYFSNGQTMKSALAAIMDGISLLSTRNIHPVVALTRGKIVTSSLDITSISGVIGLGKSWQLLERLLLEAVPNFVFTTKNTKFALTAQGFDLETEMVTGALSKKSFHAISLQSLTSSQTLVEEINEENHTVTQLDSLGVMSLDEIKTGMLINDRYEVISKIGSGGMGVVYKTYDRDLKDVVALKILNIEQKNNRFSELMKTEIRLARKVTDPNILRTFDFGEIDGLPYLSMEYVRGLTLNFVLEKTGKLPFSAGLQVAKQLASALIAAHDMNIAHRDVKPANVILDFSGRIKLMDFGLAGTHSGERAIGGTPRYASPEQLLGKDAGISGDVYSFGVVLYEIFTGKVPFTLSGTDLKALAKEQKSQTPLPAQELNPDLPEELNDMIMACIDVHPNLRPDNIGDLLSKLETIRA